MSTRAVRGDDRPDGEFLEWADVFGNLYGTGAADTEASCSTRPGLVLVIDVQGARQVRGRRPDTVGDLRAAAVVRGARARACAAAARTPRGDPAAAGRRRGPRSRPCANTTTSSSTTSSTRCVDGLRAIVLAERRAGLRRDAVEPIVSTFQRRDQWNHGRSQQARTRSSSSPWPAPARGSCSAGARPRSTGPEKLVRLAQQEVPGGDGREAHPSTRRRRTMPERRGHHADRRSA